MVVLTAIDFALNLAGGLFGGFEQQNAQQDANKMQEKMAEARFERDIQQWEINRYTDLVNYNWQVATVAAQRYQERVKEADYNTRMGLIIDNAVENLTLNAEALYDTYVVEEQLRATQVAERLGTERTLDAIQVGTRGLIAGIQSRQVRQSAKRANMQSLETVRQYMNSIKDKALQSAAAVNRKEEEGAAIVEELVSLQNIDTLKRDAQYVTALVTGSKAAAAATARQGGSNTSKRLALDAMQRFGRSYGELVAVQSDRKRRLGVFNSAMQGSFGDEMARMSLAIQEDAEKIKYTKKQNRQNRREFRLQQLGIKKQFQGELDAYTTRNESAFRQFYDLTLPGFDLAQRAGAREANALIKSTVNTIKGASVPYRPAIIFDPLEPIAGLKPEYMAPTPVPVKSWGSIMTDAFIGGVKGAAANTYTDAAGNLRFR